MTADILTGGELVAVADALARGDKAPLMRLGAERYFDGGEPADPAIFSAGDNAAAFCNDADFVWDRGDSLQVRRAKFARGLRDLGRDPFAPFSKQGWATYSIADFCALWPSPDRFTPAVPQGATVTGVPTLLIGGDIDINVPSETTSRLLQVFPNARFVSFAGALHLPTAWSECARSVAQRFIATLRTGNTDCAREPAFVPPAVPQFPGSVRQAVPATALAGNASTIDDRRVATVAVRPVLDAIIRSFRIPGATGTGYGLRGGTFDFSFETGEDVLQLHGVRFARDVAVDGKATLSFDGNEVHMDLVVSGPDGRSGSLMADGAFGFGAPYRAFIVSGTYRRPRGRGERACRLGLRSRFGSDTMRARLPTGPATMVVGAPPGEVRACVQGSKSLVRARGQLRYVAGQERGSCGWFVRLQDVTIASSASLRGREDEVVSSRARRQHRDRHAVGRMRRRAGSLRAASIAGSRDQGRRQARANRDHDRRLAVPGRSEQPAAQGVQGGGREAIGRLHDRDHPPVGQSRDGTSRHREADHREGRERHLPTGSRPCARSWSTVDVKSLSALQAPFLIESDEHVTSIVRDPAVTEQAFGGLEAVGVTGLTLFPSELRHFFSFTDPILAPADLKGRRIRVFSSPDTSELIESLGGVAVDLDDDALRAGIADGTITAIDTGFAAAAGYIGDPGQPEAANAAGNLVPYAKVNSLVVNTAFWVGLSDAQRDIISQAAAATREWAISNQTGETRAAEQFCNAGGTIFLADAPSIETFREAAAPVHAALAADPATKRLIADIRALAPAAPMANVRPCSAGATETGPIVPDGGDLPNGIYRVVFTDAYLISHGVNNPNENHGIWTFRLEDGRWSIDGLADDIAPWHMQGIYQAVGDDLRWEWDRSHHPFEGELRMSWSVTSDGSLVFTPGPGASEDWTFALPWQRVGDIPG